MRYPLGGWMLRDYNMHGPTLVVSRMRQWSPSSGIPLIPDLVEVSCDSRGVHGWTFR
jgi:hypothetical protein